MSFLTRSFRALVGSLCVAAAVSLPGAAQDVGTLDPCFEACHNSAMVLYYEGDPDGASERFDFCMDEVCGYE